jgi:tetratricopeptide (TPR) repeat protein
VGLVQVQAQAMADRYTYIPLIGLFIMIAWGGPELLKKWHYRNYFIIILSGVILLFFIICAWFQVRHWQSDFTLFEHTLNVTNNNYKAHHGIGCALLAGGNIDTAVFHFQEALKINPEYAEVRNDLGNAYIRQGKYSDAAYQYGELLRVNPESAKTNNNLGVTLALQEKYKDAIAQFRRALQLNPDYKEAKKNMETTEMQLNAYEQQKQSPSKSIDR